MFPPWDISRRRSFPARSRRTLRALADLHCVVVLHRANFRRESRIIISVVIILDTESVRHNMRVSRTTRIEGRRMTEAGGDSRADARRPPRRVALAQLVVDVRGNRGGADQSGVRLYNERLLLSLVRRFGPLVQDRSGEADGAFGAIDVGDHEPAAGGRPVEARGAAARARWAADDPDVARSRGAYSFGLKIGRRSCDLVLVDFRGAIRQRAHRDLRVSDARAIFSISSRAGASLVGSLERGAAAADRRRRRRRAVPAVDLGGGDRRAAGAMDGMAAISTRQRDRRGLPLSDDCCATTPRPPAPRSSSSAAAGAIATSFISSSARSSAADWCSTARCVGRTGNAGALGSMPVTAKATAAARRN